VKVGWRGLVCWWQKEAGHVLIAVRSKNDVSDGSMKLTIRPLTPDLWPALEDLFGENGAVGGCWCMYWRIGRAYRKRPHEENRAAFREVVKGGPPPGLLAFDGNMAVGWCQPTRRLKRVDDVPVWSLSCFYVRKGYRRRGVTSALIARL
jgi:GNAT superfamily N-acetyltransferase